jgi:hypothetical protein
VVLFYAADAGLPEHMEPQIPPDLEAIIATMVNHGSRDRPRLDAIAAACKKRAMQVRGGVRYYREAILHMMSPAARRAQSPEKQVQMQQHHSSIRAPQQASQQYQTTGVQAVGSVSSIGQPIGGGGGGGGGSGSDVLATLGGSHVVQIRLLDDATLRIPFKGSTKVDEVYRHVVHHCNVPEAGASFFGLATIGTDDAPVFLPMGDLMSDHVGSGGNSGKHTAIEFRVEFYVQNVSVLRKEWRTRHLTYLQVLRDLTSGYIAPSVNPQELYTLCALALQARFGDHTPTKHAPGYFAVNEVCSPRAPQIANPERLQGALTDLHGARFSTEIYTRGCHWIPRMFA